jgi:excisionase family DNA binding protein
LGDFMPPGALDRDEWFSLQEASERLGVSRATLRAWADRGRVHAFRTPGGHRRFRERDLAMLAARGQETAAAQPLRVLAHAALGRTRFEVSDGWLANEEWYRRFPAGAREQHRDLGRQVVMALSELISEPDAGEAHDSRAAELGKAYGVLNRQYEIALGDALRAFLFFRDAFIESLIELAKPSPTLDALALLRRASRFVDAMLLTMVESDNVPSRRKRKAG